jgi:hypothetical protein
MPQRDRRRCICSECTADNPDGKLWGIQGFAVHKARVVARQDGGRYSPLPPHQSQPEDGLNPGNDALSLDGLVYLQVLTDNGPNLDGHSRLWSSRSEVQAAIPRPLQAMSETSIPLEELALRVSSLLVDRRAPAPSSSAAPPQDIVPPRVPGAARSERAKNHHTTQALRLLSSLDNELVECRRSTLGAPSQDDLNLVCTFSRIWDSIWNSKPGKSGI